MPVSSKGGPDGVVNALRELSKRRVLVGVPASNATRSDGDEQPGVNNAFLAYVHTNGVPENNLPARPFLAPGIERARGAIVTALGGAAKAALAGDLDKAELNLELAGMKAANEAKLIIAEGIPPPLKPATVAARARKNAPKTGRRATAAEQALFNEWFNMTGSMAGSPTTPLDDTGQLLQSITFVVEKP